MIEQSSDKELLLLEEQILFEHGLYERHNDEVNELTEIVDAALNSFRNKLGVARLTNEQYLRCLDEYPEGRQRGRLEDLRDSHLNQMNSLIEKMWAIPAKTPAGRRAKLNVLLICVLDPSWRDGDWAADWDVLLARRMMIEFVGGEPGQQLRDQFA